MGTRAKLSHLDSKGRARMVDVGAKPVSRREAVAEGYVVVAPATLRAIITGKVPKGEVLAVARVAGIQAAKQCGSLIPLCHPLSLDSVEVRFDIRKPNRIRIEAVARITAKTGVEMEALAAVAVAALTIYDMCKAIDKQMRIERIRLLKKLKRNV